MRDAQNRIEEAIGLYRDALLEAQRAAWFCTWAEKLIAQQRELAELSRAHIAVARETIRFANAALNHQPSSKFSWNS